MPCVNSAPCETLWFLVCFTCVSCVMSVSLSSEHEMWVTHHFFQVLTTNFVQLRQSLIKDSLLAVTQLCLHNMISEKFAQTNLKVTSARVFPIVCVMVGYSQREIHRRRGDEVGLRNPLRSSSGGYQGGTLQEKFTFNMVMTAVSAEQPTSLGKGRGGSWSRPSLCQWKKKKNTE